jgi:hypothetical protein
MASRILSVNVLTHRLNPAEAELWVLVAVEIVSDTTEVRGRFVGPRSMRSTTVEVAYPLRPFPRLPEGLPPLARRVVIPEPSFWEPELPLVYDGVVELWEDGQRIEVRQVPGYRLLTANSTSSRSP